MSYELSNIEWKLYPKQLKIELNLFNNDSFLKNPIWKKQLKKYHDFELAKKTTAYNIITLKYSKFFFQEMHRIKSALANHQIDDPPDKFSRYILANYHGLLNLQNTNSITKPKKIIFNSPGFTLKYKKITLQRINYDLQTLFINPLKKTFEEDYQSEILPHPYIYAISERPATNHKRTNPDRKLQWRGPINKLVTIFYELANTELQDGNPVLNATPQELQEHISNNFTDKTGNDISKDTIRTILRPGRADKRSPEHKRYKIPT